LSRPKQKSPGIPPEPDRIGPLEYWSVGRNIDRAV